MSTGLFAGLITCDFAYLVDHLPGVDEKMVAAAASVASGGPATNAAVAHQRLGGNSRLAVSAGSSQLGRIVAGEVTPLVGEFIDLSSQDADRTPPVSSIFVLQSTGQRSVVSLNAQANPIGSRSWENKLLRDCGFLLVDGHNMEFCHAAASDAKRAGVLVVADGGSWKSGSELLFESVDIAICSQRFRPPGCDNEEDVAAFLRKSGCGMVAITRGPSSILCWDGEDRYEVPVPSIASIDTTGAGDIFHGAFCFYFSQNSSFRASLGLAADVAALKCLHFGTRSWLNEKLPEWKDL